MMETIEGTVDGVNAKETTYGVILDNKKWYNGKGACPCKKGDKVHINYSVNGIYKNIITLKVTDESTDIPKADVSTGSNIDSRTDDIHYQVCLKMASEIVSRNLGLFSEVGKVDEIAESVVSLATEIKKKAW